MDRLTSLLDRVAPLLVGLAAAAVLLPRLGSPDRIYFDETYYVNDARQYLELGGVESSFAVHPPLGKWLIALGIRVFGDEPAAWRLPGALLAIATVVLVFVIARRLLGSSLAAMTAALLLLFDGIFIAQARIAMLDIHLVFFVVLAVDLLLRDREARMRGDGHDPPAWWRRPYLLASGVAIGLAIATKWSGLFALGALGLVLLVTELARRLAGPLDRPAPAPAPAHAHAHATTLSAAANTRMTATDVDASPDQDVSDAHDRTTDDGSTHDGDTADHDTTIDRDPLDDEPAGWRPPSVLAAAVRTGGVALGALTLVPAVVYALSWVPWLASYEQTTEFPKHCSSAEDVEPPRDLADHPGCDTSLARRLTGLALHHEAIWRFHTNLESDHSYLAPATTWPILGRPVVFYYQSCNGDRAAGVASTDDEGNVTEPDPCEVAEGDAAEIIALGNPALWWGFLLLAPFLLARAARGDPRAAIPLVLWAGQYVPWLLSPRPSFAFYMAPLVPFVALGASASLLLLHQRAARVPRERTETSWALSVGLLLGAIGFLVGLFAQDEELGAAVGAVAAVVGVVLAERLDDRVRSGAPRWWHNHAAVLATTLGVLAVGLFVHFVPVWTAVEMAEDAVRGRWWFSSWI